MSCDIEKIKKFIQPKVSIIVPVYNSGHFVSETIDCLLSNSLKEVEVICVNDGSKDNSLDVLLEYQKKDSRVVVINKARNEGLGKARNTGILSAKGDFIAFCDSDDLVDINFYEKMYDQAVLSNSQLTVAKIDTIPYLVTTVNYFEKFTEFIRMNMQCCLGPITAFLIKRSLLLENRLLFHNYQACEEFDFCLRLGQLIDKCSFVEDTYYHYRLDINKRSITRNHCFKLDNKKFEQDLVGGVGEIFKFLNNLELPADQYSKLCANIFVDKLSVIIKNTSYISRFIAVNKFKKTAKLVKEYPLFLNYIKDISPYIYSLLCYKFRSFSYIKNSNWYYSYQFTKRLKTIKMHSYVWGYSTFFKKYAEKNHKYLYKLDGVIDLSKDAQLQSFNGKRILSPDCLLNANCFSIIIAVTHHQDEIKNTIQSFLKDNGLTSIDIITWL